MEQQSNNHSLHNTIVTNELIVEQSQGIALMRSQRKRKSAIPNDYLIYLQ